MQIFSQFAIWASKKLFMYWNWQDNHVFAIVQSDISLAVIFIKCIQLRYCGQI